MADEKAVDRPSRSGPRSCIDDVTTVEADELSMLLRSILVYLNEVPAKPRRARQP
jgi:hypothetical protein